MTLEVYTIRFGSPDWLQLCAPTLDAYCARHDLPLHIYGDDFPQYPTVKFCEIDMLKQFLAGKATHLLYVDADVFIRADAPMIDLVDGYSAVVDEPFAYWRGGWANWCQTTFGVRPDDKFRYINAGVWLCDRKAAEMILAEAQPPYVKMVQEQHQWCFWLHQASKKGMVLRELDGRWNRLSKEVFDRKSDTVEPAWFYHVLGVHKIKEYDRFASLGLVPHRPEPFIEQPAPKIPRAIVYPYKADAAKWQELRYSLRSVEKFLKDASPIIIFGTERPGWLKFHQRVIFYDAWTYQDCLTRGLQIADEVLWMNDDIVFLKDTTWDEVATPLHLGPVDNNLMAVLRNEPNSWRKGVLRAIDSLKYRGITEPLNFSTHTPYVFQRAKALPIFREFGVWSKMPFETLYFNLHPEGAQHLAGRRTQSPEFGDAKYLNYLDPKLTPQLKTAIHDLLPDYAEWELKSKF